MTYGLSPQLLLIIYEQFEMPFIMSISFVVIILSLLYINIFNTSVTNNFLLFFCTFLGFAKPTETSTEGLSDDDMQGVYPIDRI